MAPKANLRTQPKGNAQAKANARTQTAVKRERENVDSPRKAQKLQKGDSPGPTSCTRAVDTTPAKSAKGQRQSVSVEIVRVRKQSVASKTQDISTNIQAVETVLRDPRFVIPGPPTCREMLLKMAPCCLRSKGQEESRHHQIAIGIMNEIFEDVARQVQERKEKSEAEAIAARKELAAREAEVARLETALVANGKEIEHCNQKSREALATIAKANSRILEARQAQKSADMALQAGTEEKAQVTALVDASYRSLKEGLWSNFAERQQHISAVTDFLKKIRTTSIPTSLIFVEAPTALSSKPAQRKPAAEQILQEIEAIFAKHIEVLDGGLDGLVLEANSKRSETSESESFAEAANKEHSEVVSKAAAAQLERLRLEDQLKIARKAKKQQMIEVKQAEQRVPTIFADQAELEKEFQAGLKAWKSLQICEDTVESA